MQYKLLSYVTVMTCLHIQTILSKKEEEFVMYWERNREKERSVVKQFFPGLPIGLAFAAGILLLLDSGWYERANIEAQSQSSPLVIFIGLVCVVAFTGFFYKRFRWERNEQAYKELKLKAQKDMPVSID